MSAPPLGRKKVETLENKNELKAEKKQRRQDELDRNAIEGNFGVAKRRYGMARIMAKLRKTSESMIGLTILVMNLEKFVRDFFVHFFLRENMINIRIKVPACASLGIFYDEDELFIAA